MELLKSAGPYLKDPQSDKEGITLAGILIFGKPELILAALPHHRTDALLRKVNLDRYDDRDDIRVNLLESYERLNQGWGNNGDCTLTCSFLSSWYQVVRPSQTVRQHLTPSRLPAWQIPVR